MEVLIEKEVKIDAYDAILKAYYYYKEKNVVCHNLEILHDLKIVHGLNIESYTNNVIMFSLFDGLNMIIKDKTNVKLKIFENTSNVNIKRKDWRSNGKF